MAGTVAARLTGWAQALLEVLEAEHVEARAVQGDDAREPAETR